jgi:hypothetical protein
MCMVRVLLLSFAFLLLPGIRARYNSDPTNRWVWNNTSISLSPEGRLRREPGNKDEMFRKEETDSPLSLDERFIMSTRYCHFCTLCSLSVRDWQSSLSTMFPKLAGLYPNTASVSLISTEGRSHDSVIIDKHSGLTLQLGHSFSTYDMAGVVGLLGLEALAGSLGGFTRSEHVHIMN